MEQIGVLIALGAVLVTVYFGIVTGQNGRKFDRKVAFVLLFIFGAFSALFLAWQAQVHRGSDGSSEAGHLVQAGQPTQTAGASPVQPARPGTDRKFYVSTSAGRSDASAANYIAITERSFTERLSAEHLNDENGSELDLLLTNVRFDSDPDSNGINNVRAYATITATIKSPGTELPIIRSADGTGRTQDEAAASAISKAAQEIVDQLETTVRRDK